MLVVVWWLSLVLLLLSVLACYILYDININNSIIVIIITIVIIINGREADRQEGGQADDRAPATEPHFRSPLSRCRSPCLPRSSPWRGPYLRFVNFEAIWQADFKSCAR